MVITEWLSGSYFCNGQTGESTVRFIQYLQDHRIGLEMGLWDWAPTGFGSVRQGFPDARFSRFERLSCHEPLYGSGRVVETWSCSDHAVGKQAEFRCATTDGEKRRDCRDYPIDAFHAPSRRFDGAGIMLGTPGCGAIVQLALHPAPGGADRRRGDLAHVPKPVDSRHSTSPESNAVGERYRASQAPSSDLQYRFGHVVSAERTARASTSAGDETSEVF